MTERIAIWAYTQMKGILWLKPAIHPVANTHHADRFCIMIATKLLLPLIVHVQVIQTTAPVSTRGQTIP